MKRLILILGVVIGPMAQAPRLSTSKWVLSLHLASLTVVRPLCAVVSESGGILGSCIDRNIEVNIASAAATLTAHFLTLVITWRTTFSSVTLSNVRGERTGLLAMLLRDGTYRFSYLRSTIVHR